MWSNAGIDGFFISPIISKFIRGEFLNLNLNIYVAGTVSVDATGESWDDS